MEVLAEGRIRNWASVLDDATRQQAEITSRLLILSGPIALMPDAHLGKGATIGSVIATESAVIPSAVGVDIGCGMAARRLDLASWRLGRRELREWVRIMPQHVPAGLGHWHAAASEDAVRWFDEHPPPATLENPQLAMAQLGTLGVGNHFVELATDEATDVWVLLHSGSRGAGNKLATMHTKIARQVCGHPLEDPELAWLEQGTPEFAAYLRDLDWSQSYALENRRQILAAATLALEEALAGTVNVVRDVNCHHNYTALEEHEGRWLWITRKGAIRAGVGDWGLIPGSMGQKSYVVRGLGNPASYESCAHGAGRVMSRTAARKTLTVEAFGEVMGHTVWQDGDARALLDEHPAAYKPLEVVMRDQADLVRVEYELQAITNYKGVDAERRRKSPRAQGPGA
jgi:tRNA-splicing ligase RtcB